MKGYCKNEKVSERKAKLGTCSDCEYSTPKGTKSLKGEFFMGGCDFWTPDVKHPNFYFLDKECENGHYKKRKD